MYKFSHTAIKRLWDKFNETQDVIDKPRPGKPAEVNEEIKQKVEDELAKLKTSLGVAGKKCGISKTTTYKIAKELNLHFCKAELIEKRTPEIIKSRINFAETRVL